MTSNNQKSHTFWNNQPVSQNTINMVFSRCIKDQLDKQEVKSLGPLEFVELAANNIEEMVEFMNNNYYDSKVEYVKANNAFSTKKYNMQFTPNILNIILGPNNYVLGMRLKMNNMLVGMISGFPQKYQLKDKTATCYDISLICVDKRLRCKQTCNNLIMEFYNRILEKGYKNGIYTTNREVPTPCSKISVYKRPLNPSKLYDLGYFEISDKTIVEKIIDRYTIIRKLPDNIVKMDNNMIKDIYDLYTEYMERFDLHAIYTMDELNKVLTTTGVNTYVIYDKTLKRNNQNKIIDFFSFYTYDIEINKTIVKSARLYLHTILSDELTARRMTEYVSIAAHVEGMDLLYLTNTMELNEVLSDVDNNYVYDSDYYVNMYNWEIPVMKPDQISRHVMIN